MAASFSFKTSHVTIYKPTLDSFLNGTNGPVGRYLRERGRLIVVAAKRQVGVDTGALRSSIGIMAHGREVRGQYITIGSNNRIAYLHHEGSRAHRITAADHKLLRFSAGGRVVYTRSVLHPGTRPNRYLSDNLILVRA